MKGNPFAFENRAWTKFDMRHSCYHKIHCPWRKDRPVPRSLTRSSPIGKRRLLKSFQIRKSGRKTWNV